MCAINPRENLIEVFPEAVLIDLLFLIPPAPEFQCWLFSDFSSFAQPANQSQH
jgi:hypothetical protein